MQSQPNTRGLKSERKVKPLKVQIQTRFKEKEPEMSKLLPLNSPSTPRHKFDSSPPEEASKVNTTDLDVSEVFVNQKSNEHPANLYTSNEAESHKDLKKISIQSLCRNQGPESLRNLNLPVKESHLRPNAQAHFVKKLKIQELIPKAHVGRQKSANEPIYQRIFGFKRKGTFDEAEGPKKEKTDFKKRESIINIDSFCAKQSVPKEDHKAGRVLKAVFGDRQTNVYLAHKDSFSNPSKVAGKSAEINWRSKIEPVLQDILAGIEKRRTERHKLFQQLSFRSNSRESKANIQSHIPSLNIYHPEVGSESMRGNQHVRDIVSERYSRLKLKKSTQEHHLHKRSNSLTASEKVEVANKPIADHVPDIAQSNVSQGKSSRHDRVMELINAANIKQLRKHKESGVFQNDSIHLSNSKNRMNSRRFLENVKFGTKRHNSYEKLPEDNLTAGRFIARRLIYGFRTRRGYNPNDLHKKNQDSYFCKLGFLGREKFNLFGVCDGHGKHGERVSQFVSEKFPVFLESVFREEEKRSMVSEDALFEEVIEELMFRGLKQTVKALEESEIECRFSGCTFNAVFLLNDKICVCNVGDSRAIMAYEDNIEDVIVLSRDHTPYDQSEKLRIQKNGGMISQTMDEFGQACGPLRVWKPGENLPGLAMTRAVGDTYSKSVGVSWKPDMTVKSLKISQQVVIFLSTDGVFEVMSNEEVMKVIAPFIETKNVEAACDTLMARVTKEWDANNYDVIDDITFILLFI